MKRSIIITGGNTGIGYSCAGYIARNCKDYAIIIACRNVKKGSDAAEKIKEKNSASQSGNYSAMRDYVTGDFDALEEFLELGDLNAEDLLEESVEAFGIKASDFTDETKVSFENLLDVMVKNVIRSYKITEVRADKESAVVVVDWVTAYSDPSNMESFIGMDGDLEQILADYRVEHSDELDALEAAEGETAVTAEIFNRLFPDTFTEAAENVAALSDVEMKSELILIQQNGKWLINDMKGDNVPADGNKEE